jgi:queuine/archaeosine tRNA-ribosyltransferase
MFDFQTQAKNNRARTGIFSTPHGDLLTPVFAPAAESIILALKTIPD